MNEREMIEMLEGDQALRTAVRLREERMGQMPEGLNERVFRTLDQREERPGRLLTLVQTVTSAAAVVLVGLFAFQQMEETGTSVRHGERVAVEEEAIGSMVGRMIAERQQPRREKMLSYTQIKEMYHEKY